MLLSSARCSSLSNTSSVGMTIWMPAQLVTFTLRQATSLDYWGKGTMNYYLRNDLIAKGWTATAIKRFLGEPVIDYRHGERRG
jgi:hypothetical protein